MQNHWNESEASEYPHELGQLAYATRLLGREAALGLYRTGNASLKTLERNIYSEAEKVLYIENGQQPSAAIDHSGFTALRCVPLVNLARLDALSADQLENELACSRTHVTDSLAPVDAVLHAVLPFRCVLSAQPDAIMAIACTPDGMNRLRQIYGASVICLPYAASGHALAQACANALPLIQTPQVVGIFVMHQMLITFGDTAQFAYQRMLDVVDRAEQYLAQHSIVNSEVPSEAVPAKLNPAELPALRKAISNAAGFPLILSVSSDPASLSFSRRTDIPDFAQAGPAVAEHAAFTKRYPMLGRDVPAYCETYAQSFSEHVAARSVPVIDFAPRIVLDPSFGMCALGRTAAEAALASRIQQHNQDIFLRARALDAYQALPPKEGFEAEAAAARSSSTSHTSATLFNGEVALVTGGASGIGKACVESLLARGAAVVSFDINPTVAHMYDRPDYLGLVCDLMDENAIIRAFETLTKAYGGLDMLVLNAGIFPAGRRIEALALAEWQKVMRINLDSNLVVLREAHPLLKESPRGGRVLVNASKNVLAPGIGAAAYSASKAGVTQIARIAALEWGKDHIRVNMIHPDAIFDTGIWSEEVLKTRAANYGMTVQQYKTRNVLGVELNSHYVGELVAEMLGPLFEKITGAQIPVDGGSDRVI